MEKAEMSVIVFDNSDVIATSGVPTHYLAHWVQHTIQDTDMATEMMASRAADNSSGLNITKSPNTLTAYNWVNSQWIEGDSLPLVHNILMDSGLSPNDFELGGVYILSGGSALEASNYSPCNDLNTPILHDHSFIIN